MGHVSCQVLNFLHEKIFRKEPKKLVFNPAKAYSFPVGRPDPTPSAILTTMKTPKEIAITGSKSMKDLLMAFGKIDNWTPESEGRKYLTIKLTVDSTCVPTAIGGNANAEDCAKAMESMPEGFEILLARYQAKAKAIRDERVKGQLVPSWKIAIKAEKI